MKFPGKRKTRHYFPVTEHGRIPFDGDFTHENRAYIVGIDQLIVDIEVNVSDEFLAKYNIAKGQSMVIPDDQAEQIFAELTSDQIVAQYAGGVTGNTLHNYSVLTDDRSILLGTICEHISPGDFAFNYVCNTCSLVDFSYVQPCTGQMPRAICFITPNKERTFCIIKGMMNDLHEDYIPEDVIKDSAALLITTYLLRDETAPMFKAVHKAVKIANANNVPVILSLGTSLLVEEKNSFLNNFIKEHVNIVAMNEDEALALTGIEDTLLAGEKILDIADMALITVGPKGLYLCGHVDQNFAKLTTDQIHSKSIPEYNKYEYSRAMLKIKCKNPIKIYTHINPFMGGPGKITNTNGAGDTALAAILHDIAANTYHKQTQPMSPKHVFDCLTYSSLHQVSKYANRVSYEVLKQNSPRLAHGLPEKEASLEDAYWEL